jgi:hypothetical protein
MRRSLATEGLLILPLCLTTGCQPSQRVSNNTPTSSTAVQSSSNCDWTRAGQSVLFRAEVMPGLEAAKRTYRVSKVLPSCRALLEGIGGEHARAEFEPARWMPYRADA